MTYDPFELQRFVDAQLCSYGGYESACSELEAGRKLTHWMWYIFPRLRGLGHTEVAKHYGIADLEEARAYVRHPSLGSRLCKCTKILVSLPSYATADQVFGDTDSQKLCSSMTLFELADPTEPSYAQVLVRYFQGHRDALTLKMLSLE